MLTATLAVLIAGCGGESGAEEPPGFDAVVQSLERLDGHDDPVAAQALALHVMLEPPTPAPGIHQIALRWSGTAGHGGSASVWLSPAQDQPFRAIATGLRGQGATVSVGSIWSLDWPTARVRVRACDAAKRCRDSNAQPLVDAFSTAVAQVAPDEQTLFSSFSYGVALSANGNTLVVANPTDFPAAQDPRPPGVGSVYVFQRDATGQWRREALLDNFKSEGNFGNPMALSGDGQTLVIGAYTDSGSAGGIDPAPPNSALTWSGAAYVYVHDAQQRLWTRQAFIKAAQPREYEAFGSHLALSADGNRLAVNGDGRLHVFERSGLQWRQAALLQHPVEHVVLTPDAALAISGDGQVVASTLQIGDGADGTLHGPVTAVFVYAADATGTWQHRADLRSAKAPARDIDDDFFGKSLALDHAGVTLAVGAPRDAGDAHDTSGDPANTAAPGAGAVYIFRASSSGVWQRSAFLKASNAPAQDEFGSSVALSADGRVLAAKACGFAAQAPGMHRNHRATTVLGHEDGVPGCYWGGSAYVLQQDAAGVWSHSTTIIPVDTDLVPFGFFSLAMSADAQTIALGATAYDAQFNPRDRVFVY